MVILGKKAKALLRRIEQLERYKEVACNDNTTACEKIEKLETALKEIMLFMKNDFDGKEPRRTPQQLLREWFLGKESDE